MTRIDTFEFVPTLWRYPGADGWHFVSLPAEISPDITDLAAGNTHVRHLSTRPERTRLTWRRLHRPLRPLRLEQVPGLANRLRRLLRPPARTMD